MSVTPGLVLVVVGVPRVLPSICIYTQTLCICRDSSPFPNRQQPLERAQALFKSGLWLCGLFSCFVCKGQRRNDFFYLFFWGKSCTQIFNWAELLEGKWKNKSWSKPWDFFGDFSPQTCGWNGSWLCLPDAPFLPKDNPLCVGLNPIKSPGSGGIFQLCQVTVNCSQSPGRRVCWWLCFSPGDKERSCLRTKKEVERPRGHDKEISLS